MKKTVFLFLVAGLLGGFALGRISQSGKPSAIPDSGQLAETKPTPAAPLREQALLLQAIHELDLTTAELDDALAYIQKLERNTRRYDWLMDYWQGKGFGRSYQMRFKSRQQFKPSEDLIEFFGWDATQVEALTRAGEEVSEAIKGWEGEQAFCIEDSEDSLVYEIPAMPEESVERYMQALEAVLDPDDMALLSSTYEENFGGVLQDRILTMSISSTPGFFSPTSNDPGQKYIQIRMESKDAESLWGGSAMSYRPGTSFPQWDHVFELEEGTPNIFSAGSLD